MNTQIKHLFAFVLVLITGMANAQHPEISIHDLQYVSPSDLANCNDTSMYLDDTVIVVGKAVHDGNLTEIPSGSIQGDYRPGIFLVDTTDNGVMGPFKGVQVMGVYDGNLPASRINSILAGNIVKMTVWVNRYAGETQISPIDNSASSIQVLGFSDAPKPIPVSIGDLNDNQRVNKLETGEQWEGSLIELTDVTVTFVDLFNGGSRVSFNVTDKDGNVINVSDRFLVQKLPSHTTANPASPANTGSFVAPVVGAKFDTLRGIVIHSENGCRGGSSSARGYEMNPFDASHYVVGNTPPSITETTHAPKQPKSSDKVMVSANVEDFNGSIQSVELFYSEDINQAYNQFTAVPFALKNGSQIEYEGEIPAKGDGTLIRYYIKAVDNDNNISYYPFNAADNDANFGFYTVRDNGLTIVDIQRVLNPNNDASPYAGEEVTVTGVVTASTKDYDLGDVYIQDPNATEWAGLFLTGNSDLIKLFRTQEVTVTGTITESYGFTQMNVSNVVVTGNRINVKPVNINPFESGFFTSGAAEKYESMLLNYYNPGNKIVVSDEDINYAEFLVAPTASSPTEESARVQTGRRDGSNFSSLWTSVITDTFYINNDGELKTPAVITQNGQSMDSLTGMLYYGFSTFKLLPRNNDDFVGFSETLEETDYPDLPQIDGVRKLNNTSFTVYPNPANETLQIKANTTESLKVNIINLNGQLVHSATAAQGKAQINISHLPAGFYTVKLVSETQQLIGTAKLIVK